MANQLDIKPNMLVVALDGDGIGKLVGRAVLANDPDKLHEVSGRIDAAQDFILSWVKENDGIKISGGGDEAVIAIPKDAKDSVEALRKDIEHAFGYTISVGIGSSLSEAGTALLVAKLRGKDQIVTFTKEIEKDIQNARKRVKKGKATQEEYKLSEAYLEKGEHMKICKLHKAKVDEGKSIEDKQKDRGARHIRSKIGEKTVGWSSNHPKGAHPDYTTPGTPGGGTSHAGFANSVGQTKYAKEEHKRVLSEIKSMPKPKLDKGEHVCDLHKAISDKGLSPDAKAKARVDRGNVRYHYDSHSAAKNGGANDASWEHGHVPHAGKPGQKVTGHAPGPETTYLHSHGDYEKGAGKEIGKEAHGIAMANIKASKFNKSETSSSYPKSDCDHDFTIGQTQSGKKVHLDHEHPSHASFTEQDHKDAAGIHGKLEAHHTAKANKNINDNEKSKFHMSLSNQHNRAGYQHKEMGGMFKSEEISQEEPSQQDAVDQDEADCPYCEQTDGIDHDNCPYCQEDDANDHSDCPYCQETEEHEGSEEDCQYCQDDQGAGAMGIGPMVSNPTTTRSDDFAGQDLDPPQIAQQDGTTNPSQLLGGSNNSAPNPDMNAQGGGIPEDDTTSQQALQQIADEIETTLPNGQADPASMKDMDDSDMPSGNDVEGNISRPDNFDQNVPGDMGLAEDDESAPDLSGVLQEGLDSHADGIQREKVIQMASQALQGFKTCRDVIEKAKDQAPQLYNSSIMMLKAMIEMAKMLGLGDEVEQGGDPSQGGEAAPEDDQWNDPFPTHPDNGGQAKPGHAPSAAGQGAAAPDPKTRRQ